VFSVPEYDMVSLNFPCIMFFCCECQPKVNGAFEIFDKKYTRQDKFDKRLQRIEQKLDSLSEEACDVQEGNEVRPGKGRILLKFLIYFTNPWE